MELLFSYLRILQTPRKNRHHRRLNVKCFLCPNCERNQSWNTESKSRFLIKNCSLNSKHSIVPFLVAENALATTQAMNSCSVEIANEMTFGTWELGRWSKVVNPMRAFCNPLEPNIAEQKACLFALKHGMPSVAIFTLRFKGEPSCEVGWMTRR